MRYRIRGVADIYVSKEFESAVLSRLGKFMGTVLNPKKKISFRHLKVENKGYTTHGSMKIGSVSWPLCVFPIF